MHVNTDHKLLAIVAVDPNDRVQCGQPGCGHSVYARIHVVREGTELMVLGSTCFEKRYGSASALGAASYGGGSGRQLTAEEREMLVSNTAQLLARFEDERLREIALATARAEESRRQKPQLPNSASFYPGSTIAATASAPGATPWSWKARGTSMFYIQLREGSGWVRVQSAQGVQFLVPWPTFDGWDEALPAHIGPVDLEHGGYKLDDVAAALRYLRQMSNWELVSGIWSEILAEIAKR